MSGPPRVGEIWTQHTLPPGTSEQQMAWALAAPTGTCQVIAVDRVAVRYQEVSPQRRPGIWRAARDEFERLWKRV